MVVDEEEPATMMRSAREEIVVAVQKKKKEITREQPKQRCGGSLQPTGGGRRGAVDSIFREREINGERARFKRERVYDERDHQCNLGKPHVPSV
ncbi:hypothetical protein R6Q59_030320 [Mikania micrantha]